MTVSTSRRRSVTADTLSVFPSVRNLLSFFVAV